MAPKLKKTAKQKKKKSHPAGNGKYSLKIFHRNRLFQQQQQFKKKKIGEESQPTISVEF